MNRSCNSDAPSNAFEHLLGCVGSWDGINQLWLAPGEPPAESPSQLVITAVAGKKILRLDQAWSHDGQSQDGSMQVGFEPRTGEATGIWTDSFHMGRRMMVCTGHLSTHAVVLRGTYPADPAANDRPAWGWSIFIAAVPGVELSITMYNIPPKGTEEIAVKSVFAPAM